MGGLGIRGVSTIYDSSVHSSRFMRILHGLRALPGSLVRGNLGTLLRGPWWQGAVDLLHQTSTGHTRLSGNNFFLVVRLVFGARSQLASAASVLLGVVLGFGLVCRSGSSLVWSVSSVCPSVCFPARCLCRSHGWIAMSKPNLRS